MIVATFHMGVRWQRALESKVAFSFVATWGWLRVANALLFFLILFGFLGGIGLLAKVAVNIASGPTPPAAASPAEAQSLHIPHQSALPLPSDKRLTHRSSGPPPAAAELNRQHGIAR